MVFGSHLQPRKALSVLALLESLLYPEVAEELVSQALGGSQEINQKHVERVQGHRLEHFCPSFHIDVGVWPADGKEGEDRKGRKHVDNSHNSVEC